MVEPVKLLPCRCGAVLVSRQTTAPLDPSPETWWAHPPSECPLFCVGFPESKIPAWNAIMSPSPREAELEDALRKAEQFIVNGIDYGFISLPEDKGDPAHDTLPAIRTALSAPAVSPESNTGNASADEKGNSHEAN